MRKLVFLLIFIFGWGLEVPNAQSSECGTWRIMIIPESTPTPSHFLRLFQGQFTLKELLSINPGLTEKNFKPGDTVCLPIRTDEYWSVVRGKDTELAGLLKAAKTTIGEKNKEVETLKSQLSWHALLSDSKSYIIAALSFLSLVLFFLWRACAKNLKRFSRVASPGNSLRSLFENLITSVMRR